MIPAAMAGNRSGGKDQKTQALPAPDVGKAGGNMGSSLPPPPAPPAPGAPTGGAQSGQKTMMLDQGAPAPVVAPQRQRVVPTMMRQRPEDLPPMRSQRAWGRWVVGPLLSLTVAAGSFYAAKAFLPRQQKGAPPKPQGRLRLSSDPTGAQIMLDGKIHPHFTPTTVEGDVGASVHVSFSLDGYKPKDADLVFGETDRAFTARLEKSDPTSAPAPAPVPAKPSHKASKEPKETGSAKLSVYVHPWAIVYVDGSKVHQTPVVDLELNAGKHVVELVNEGKNRREKIQIVIKPDEPQDIKRDWD